MVALVDGVADAGRGTPNHYSLSRSRDSFPLLYGNPFLVTNVRRPFAAGSGWERRSRNSWTERARACSRPGAGTDVGIERSLFSWKLQE